MDNLTTMKMFTIIKEMSERVNQKNFRLLGGKPLWRHTIDEFAGCDVYINTDSERLLGDSSLAQSESLTLIARKQKHIDWENRVTELGSPVNDMLGDFFDEYVEDPEEPVVLFHVTSPFLKLSTVMDAVQYLSAGYGSVQSVVKIQDYVWIQENGELTPINFNPGHLNRTQDLPPIFVSRGAFFILDKTGFQKTRTRDVEPRFLYPLSGSEAIDIDTNDDFEFASQWVESTQGRFAPPHD